MKRGRKKKKKEREKKKKGKNGKGEGKLPHRKEGSSQAGNRGKRGGTGKNA